MEQTIKDRALKKALAPEEPRQLPSNFPYLTLRRIKEAQSLSFQIAYEDYAARFTL